MRVDGQEQHKCKKSDWTTQHSFVKLSRSRQISREWTGYFNHFRFVPRVIYCRQTFTCTTLSTLRWEGTLERSNKTQRLIWKGVLENSLAVESSLKFMHTFSESVLLLGLRGFSSESNVSVHRQTPIPHPPPLLPQVLFWACLHSDVKWGGMYENKGITSWVISIMLLSISSQFLGVHYCIISFVPMLFHQGQCWFTQFYQRFLLWEPRQSVVIYIILRDFWIILASTF